MQTTTATQKGQVLIPVALRNKLNIRKGTRLSVIEKDGKIVMEPLQDDLIKAGRGMLKSKGKVLNTLLVDRRYEAKK